LNPLSSKKTIVVGAGGGGIASALLAAKRGEKVILLESHSALGGCASWFRRGKFIFDAGATTVSGVGINEPLGELFEILGHAPELKASDPGIVFRLSSGKIIHYFRDFEKWMNELHRHFPGMNHRPFWELTRKINKKSWSLLRDVRTFPFQKISDLRDVLKHPEYVTLVPYLMISTEAALKFYQLDHPQYLELINGILLISAQAHSEKIPFIVGAMALSYPSETYAPVGGMKGLMDFFETELQRLGVEVRTSAKVERFSSHSVVLSSGEEIAGDRLIINLPVWNMARMTTGTLKNELQRESENHPGSWGAFTLYFGVKSHIRELYHQVHLLHPDVQNYFVSFSLPGDFKRAPEGYQAVSISTHVYADEACDKNYLTKIIMEDFMKRFPVSDVKFLTSGSPKTFERYTGRMNGFVGGLPFLYGKNPLSLLSPLTHRPTVMRVGDTVFPGQGLCGVVAGAMQLHHRLA
jgi:phytoene dehydrogenase-like protein